MVQGHPTPCSGSGGQWPSLSSGRRNADIEYLKNNCLEKDSVVNCDETWCCVKVSDKFRKRYVWCLVNRLEKVAIYCYEDGPRGRKAQKEILEGRELRASRRMATMYTCTLTMKRLISTTSAAWPT